MKKQWTFCAALLLHVAVYTPIGISAQQTSAASSAISNVRYELTFNHATASSRSLHVSMTFDARGTDPLRLALPVWTPGAYEVSNFARKVSNFTATSGSRALRWDKTGPSGWRVTPVGGSVTVSFDFLADTLDNAMAWATSDFLLVNGTNVFLYPESGTLDFPATVKVNTEAGWKVATGMRAAGSNTFAESNYHDLVDKPFFIGAFDLDSAQSNGHWSRLATYPARMLNGAPRADITKHIGNMIGAESAVFGEIPWETYTTMMIFDSTYGGGSALEHTNSHVAVYNPGFIGQPDLALVTGHEIFHAWNVKRLRPVDMWPYHYGSEQPTPWLWVSEGITDYYADLAMVRGGVVPQEAFNALTSNKIASVAAVPPIALEDASLSTWIHPVEGDAYIYYPKGSLAGLLLDVIIRDASDNRSSLDAVMRELYTKDYKAGHGFTPEEWWGAVSRAANGRSFTSFNERYVDGRDPLPYDSILPLAGFAVLNKQIREPRIGVSTSAGDGGVVVSSVVPGSMAEEAGIRAGDVLIDVGGVAATSNDFGAQYRERYGSAAEGSPVAIKVKRGTESLTLNGKVRFATRTETSIGFDPNASPKAKRIRDSILTGR